MDRLDEALATFKAVLAEERGKRGRDYIRKKPQGLLLDALDAGRPDTSHDELASVRGKIRREEHARNFIELCNQTDKRRMPPCPE